MQDKTRTRYPCKYGPSQVAELTAVRESELGVFLDAETGNTSDDILLHKVQQTAPVKVGDRVRVFLYLDPKRRLTASMRTPRMKEGQVARLRVINVTKEGAFLDVGAERGIFLPYAGMRGRPQVGETVWAKLYTDKSGRLAVTMEVEDELRRASRPAEGVRIGDRLKGSVYNITERGAFLFTEERYIVFIDHREIPHRPRVGETVEMRVTYLREDGRLNASLRPPKEEARREDAERLSWRNTTERCPIRIPPRRKSFRIAFISVKPLSSVHSGDCSRKVSSNSVMVGHIYLRKTKSLSFL